MFSLLFPATGNSWCSAPFAEGVPPTLLSRGSRLGCGRALRHLGRRAPWGMAKGTRGTGRAGLTVLPYLVEEKLVALKLLPILKSRVGCVCEGGMFVILKDLPLMYTFLFPPKIHETN